jgi:hypothetical protein
MTAEPPRHRRAFTRGTADKPRRRRYQYGVRVSGEERAGLEQRAGVRGVSVARLLVDCALERPLPAPDLKHPSFEQLRPYYAVLDWLQREIGRIGNNVNQLARAANTTGEIPTERRLREVLEEARAAIAAVHQESVRLSRL